MSRGPTCRCPLCGRNNAGRPGGKSFGSYHVGMWRGDGGWGEMGPDRHQERRLRRRREKQYWQSEAALAAMEVF